MKLNVNIENLGKIVSGKVALNGLTLFCGANNTGKTFVSKTLYSVLRAVNFNHGWNEINRDVRRLHRLLASDSEEREGSALLQEVTDLATIPAPFLDLPAIGEGDYVARVRAVAKRAGELEELALPRLPKVPKKELRDFAKLGIRSPAEELRLSINAIKKFAKKSQESVIEDSINNAFPSLLMNNFLRPRISDLVTIGKRRFVFSIKGAIDIVAEGAKCRISHKDISKISGIPSIFYLDGAALKIGERLIRTMGRMSSRYSRMVPYLPYYHNNFLDALEVQLASSDDLQDQMKEIVEAIGGKLGYTGGGIHFQEKDIGRIPLQLVSSGVRQLGSLGLLIDRGLILKNSTIFIDEPETNLHPLWQGVMAHVLAGLAKKEINIVVATHSPYIVQHMRYLANADKKLNSLLTVNHYSHDKEINESLKGVKSNYDKLELVEEELNEIYMSTLLREINNV